MTISSLSTEELTHQLKSQGLCFQTGPFVIKLFSSFSDVAEGIASLYADYPLASTSDFIDFHIAITPPKNWRRWYRPQVEFYFDQYKPFRPLPADQAFAMFEWSSNWCVANHMHQYLILHAAVLERNGNVVIMPGSPGAGKSTLCAALSTRGWRLLSDELTLVNRTDITVAPLPRPVSLKNASIDIIKNYAPECVIGPIATDTSKGTVAHMKASSDSVNRAQEVAKAKWIIFPKYMPNSEALLTPLDKAPSFMRVAENSFNYSVLHQHGFETLVSLIDCCDCYDFTYSQLDDAVTIFNNLKPPVE